MPQPLLTDAAGLSGRGWLHHRGHALLGAFAMCHFAYRFAKFFSDVGPGGDGDMGFDDAAASPPMLLLLLPHLLLQVSGFGFRVPRLRHPDGNRIWPEYRWHALAFFARCSALMTLAFRRKRRLGPLGPPPAPANAAVVFVTMICADSVSRYFRSRGESSDTIRNLRGPPGLRYLMSSAQFHAAVNCLLTSDRLSVQVAALFVVQSSAFGMTLRRKGIITQGGGFALYGLALALGMVVIRRDLDERGATCAATAAGNLAALARMDGGINKYAVWAAVTAALPAISGGEPWPPPEAWLSLSRLSCIALLFGAVRRQVLARKKDARSLQ